MKSKVFIEYLFNTLIIILSLLGIIFILNSMVQCDVVIKTDYPFCNQEVNYTIVNADFYTIKYIRNLYGYDKQNTWVLSSCSLGKPYLFLLKDIRRDKHPYYNETFK